MSDVIFRSRSGLMVKGHEDITLCCTDSSSRTISEICPMGSWVLLFLRWMSGKGNECGAI